MHRVVLIPLILAALPLQVWGQDAPDDSELFYAVRSEAMIYQLSDTTRPYVALKLREPVFRVEGDSAWMTVRTGDGARGLMRTSDVSNVWIRISKKSQTLYVYRGGELVQRMPADLGYNFFADKIKRGAPDEPDHWRTPNGVFHVVMKNANSQYHRAFVLNYPNREDAERGLRDSLITTQQYRDILAADRVFRMPPMNTPLGGWIEIHGDGTGRRANWTQGCVAIENHIIDRLWELVHVGTPVVIEP
ncbi:MAG: L,D-transpeptidase [Rhodothermales bacterium]|nr:L,D-transpeptidase [Rhodothermales bacterium]MBO6778269.1 L,D-transpeptidase [Rhodothermales bacterium]